MIIKDGKFVDDDGKSYTINEVLIKDLKTKIIFKINHSSQVGRIDISLNVPSGIAENINEITKFTGLFGKEYKIEENGIKTAWYMETQILIEYCRSNFIPLSIIYE
jgi:hypothetical protein